MKIEPRFEARIQLPPLKEDRGGWQATISRKAPFQVNGSEEKQEASCERVKQTKTSRIESIGQ